MRSCRYGSYPDVRETEGWSLAVQASIFLSWAHRDRRAKDNLVERLDLSAQTGVRIDWWEESHDVDRVLPVML